MVVVNDKKAWLYTERGQTTATLEVLKLLGEHERCDQTPLHCTAMPDRMH